jgi:DNA-directed RNA polymerase specialized sigma24 family protein
MSSDEEFQVWINDLARGEGAAAETLWEQYFQRLATFARRKLEGMPRRAADEEDVAISALNSFVGGVERGVFPRLADPTDLWRLLLVITARKAIAQRKRHFAEKRGGGQVHGESAFLKPGADEGCTIGDVLGPAPNAELEVMMKEQCEVLLEGLDDVHLRVVALCKLEGYSNDEIANSFDTSTRTVERWLRRIRQQWEHRQ